MELVHGAPIAAGTHPRELLRPCGADRRRPRGGPRAASCTATSSRTISFVTRDGRVKVLDFGLATDRRALRAPGTAHGRPRPTRDDPRHRRLHVAGAGARSSVLDPQLGPVLARMWCSMSWRPGSVPSSATRQRDAGGDLRDERTAAATYAAAAAVDDRGCSAKDP